METFVRCPTCGNAHFDSHPCPVCAAAQRLVESQAPAQPQPAVAGPPIPSAPPMRSFRMTKTTPAAIIGALLIIAVAAWAVYNFVPGVKPVPAGYYTSEQLEQVKKGMTYEQVLEVFHKYPNKPLQQKTDEYGPYLFAAWENPDGSEADVWFDVNGFVIDTMDTRLP